MLDFLKLWLIFLGVFGYVATMIYLVVVHHNWIAAIVMMSGLAAAQWTLMTNGGKF